MDRETALTVGLALLAVLALGVAAATIDTAVTTDEGGSFGGGDGDGAGIGEDDPDTVGSDDPAAETQIRPLLGCFPELREPPALLALLLILGTFFGLTYRDTGSVFASGVVAFALSIPLLLVWFLFAFCHNQRSEIDEAFLIGLGNQTDDQELFPEAGGASGLGQSAAETVSTPSAVFTILVVVAVLASVVLLLTARADDEPEGVPEAPDEEDDAEAEIAEFGRAAGEAADRIEDDAAVDNEVYRAWREMTEPLDVSRPESSTPGEFAEAAVDAGVDREHAELLTDLFGEVRYGGAEPTSERERRAVETLREIEAAYAREDVETTHPEVDD